MRARAQLSLAPNTPSPSTSRRPAFAGPVADLGGTPWTRFRPFVKRRPGASRLAESTGEQKASPPTPPRSPGQKMLRNLTGDLDSVYSKCNPGRKRRASAQPRRVLTKPAEPRIAGSQDNANFDLIISVGDQLTNRSTSYQVQDLLGHGTFGQVIKCNVVGTNDTVAIKVIKSKPAYSRQAEKEIAFLQQVAASGAQAEATVVQLQTSFVFAGHQCLVFELLSLDLYAVLKEYSYRGLPLNLVRTFMTNVLRAMQVLDRLGIVHSDLKPENILLTKSTTPRVKLVDFGSACYEGETGISYVQSRFYRSPEVLLGLPHDAGIDMWSLGCIAAELFVGLPLFPGMSEYDQLRRICAMLGLPPDWMLKAGAKTTQYFNHKVSTPAGSGHPARTPSPDVPVKPRAPITAATTSDETKPQELTVSTKVSPVAAAKAESLFDSGPPPQGTPPPHGSPPTAAPKPQVAVSAATADKFHGVTAAACPFVLKTQAQIAKEAKTTPRKPKAYFRHKTLRDIIMLYHFRSRSTATQRAAEIEHRMSFYDFLSGLLSLDPLHRWTPLQALHHPFITGTSTGKAFVPPPDEATQAKRRHTAARAHIPLRRMSGSSSSLSPAMPGTPPSVLIPTAHPGQYLGAGHHMAQVQGARWVAGGTLPRYATQPPAHAAHHVVLHHKTHSAHAGHAAAPTSSPAGSPRVGEGAGAGSGEADSTTSPSNAAATDVAATPAVVAAAPPAVPPSIAWPAPGYQQPPVVVYTPGAPYYMPSQPQQGHWVQSVPMQLAGVAPPTAGVYAQAPAPGPGGVWYQPPMAYVPTGYVPVPVQYQPQQQAWPGYQGHSQQWPGAVVYSTAPPAPPAGPARQHDESKPDS